MSMLTRVLYTLTAVSAVAYIANAIFMFFGVGFETYGIYLFFLIALEFVESYVKELSPNNNTFLPTNEDNV